MGYSLAMDWSWIASGRMAQVSRVGRSLVVMRSVVGFSMVGGVRRSVSIESMVQVWGKELRPDKV